MAEAGVKSETPTAFRLHATLIVVFAAAIVIMAVIAFWPHPPASATNPIDMSAKMDGCRVETLKTLDMTNVNIATLYQVSGFCYSAIRNASLLGEFNIRRLSLVSQQFETLVIMWMVVAITISGVILAGIQLAAAYSLATLGKGEFTQNTQLTAEQGRISMQSSVTGLLILTVSLAFFFVFVKFVYKLDVLQTSLGEDSVTVQSAAQPAKAPRLGGYAAVEAASDTAAAKAQPASANSVSPRTPGEAQRKHTPASHTPNNARKSANDSSMH
jgi:hypothetical protein